MSGRQVAGGLLAGLVAGFVGGLFGVGGGIILIPILTALFALTQHQAHGTSLGVIGITALAALASYALRGQVDWLGAAFIAPTSIVTARIGARWTARTSPAGLKAAFAGFLALVALRLLWQPPHAHALLPAKTLGLTMAFDAALGSVAGLLAGFMGVGGGIVIVPALVILRGFEQHIAQGTSLAVILAIAPFATLEHARHGHVAARWIPALGAGAALGGPVGAGVAHQLSNPVLTRAFALFLLVNAIYTFRAAREARTKPPVLGAGGAGA